MSASVPGPEGLVETPLAEINVTPLVDVMLVLLIIFMIAAPMLDQGIDVNLPESSSGAVAETQDEPMVVTVDAEGRCYLGKEVLAPTALTDRLRRMKGVGQQTVHVRADESVPYGKVVVALDAVRQAGIEKLAMVTLPRRAGP